MSDTHAGDDQQVSSDSATCESFALALQGARREVRCTARRAVQEVGERLRGNLDSRGIMLTAGILRALAFAQFRAAVFFPQKRPSACLSPALG